MFYLLFHILKPISQYIDLSYLSGECTYIGAAMFLIKAFPALNRAKM